MKPKTVSKITKDTAGLHR